MKNQSFGDVNDFFKYGLLRALTGKGAAQVGICWMLTSNARDATGMGVDYLDEPARFRNHDQWLFDQLQRLVAVRGLRDVRCAEQEGLIAGARYFDRQLPDDDEARRKYFHDFWEFAEGCDLLFFDPDRGMETRSTRPGRKGSSGYLYWRELARAFLRGYAVLLYQPTPEDQREAFINRLAAELFQKTGANKVYTFQTDSVAYFLLLSRYRKVALERNISVIESRWEPAVVIRRHKFLTRTIRPPLDDS